MAAAKMEERLQDIHNRISSLEAPLLEAREIHEDVEWADKNGTPYNNGNWETRMADKNNKKICPTDDPEDTWSAVIVKLPIVKQFLLCWSTWGPEPKRDPKDKTQKPKDPERGWEKYTWPEVVKDPTKAWKEYTKAKKVLDEYTKVWEEYTKDPTNKERPKEDHTKANGLAWHMWLWLENQRSHTDESHRKTDTYWSLFCFAMIGCGTVGFLANTTLGLWDFEQHRFTIEALLLLKFVNDICGIWLYIGVLILWFATNFGHLGYLDPEAHTAKGKPSHGWAHRLLSSGLWKQNFMAAGFAPRLFVVTIGILLFTSQNMVATSMVPGAQFQKKKGAKGSPSVGMIQAGFVGWPVGMGCRADEKLPNGFKKAWFYRLQTQSPMGCYNVKSPQWTWQEAPTGRKGFGRLFTRVVGGILGRLVSGSEAAPFWSKPGGPLGKAPVAANLVHPFVVGSGTMLPNNEIVNATIDRTHICLYQCVKWRSLSVQGAIKNIGMLLGGAVFIERLTNWITTRLGFALITTKSSPQEVEQAIARTLQTKGSTFFNRSISLLFFVCLMLLLGSMTALLDSDGYYTVDFYVTKVFLFSISCACVLRNFHPHSWSFMVFTQDLWALGKDTFISSHWQSASTRAIDLYEWYHVNPLARAGYLLSYARLVDMRALPFYSSSAESSDMLNEDGTDKKAVKLSKVICVKEFCGFSDVYSNFHGKWERRRVVVMEGANGVVLGKTHNDMIMVSWSANPKNRSLIKEFRNNEKTGKSDPVDLNWADESINFGIDPLRILEVSISMKSAIGMATWEGLHARLSFITQQAERTDREFPTGVEITWAQSADWYNSVMNKKIQEEGLEEVEEEEGLVAGEAKEEFG